VDCEQSGLLTAATVVDHKKPHRGDPHLFWDETNWQGLCKSCHDRKTVHKDGGFGRSALLDPARCPVCSRPLIAVMRRGKVQWMCGCPSAATGEGRQNSAARAA
jgi:hypothetical protein